MFTGLVEAIGRVAGITRSGPGARLSVAVTWPDREAPDAGDSIAVNGVCLTALGPTAERFDADLSPETVARTRLASLPPGAGLNLERALRVGQRLGGHFVQGHVDAVVRLLAASVEGQFTRWRVSVPRGCERELTRKGSVALDGVSLTVAELGGDWFEVALIPETLASTTLGALRPGAELHLETDVIAKYVARAVGLHDGRPGAFEEFLAGGLGATD
ncbi:MAG: riboflavin synthase [Acidobacteria bacterium]|jgi:riboflavin synthase|nr:riboflavin synthase [Acidobacteriota bacterium]